MVLALPNLEGVRSFPQTSYQPHPTPTKLRPLIWLSSLSDKVFNNFQSIGAARPGHFVCMPNTRMFQILGPWRVRRPAEFFMLKNRRVITEGPL